MERFLSISYDMSSVSQHPSWPYMAVHKRPGKIRCLDGILQREDPLFFEEKENAESLAAVNFCQQPQEGTPVLAHPCPWPSYLLRWKIADFKAEIFVGLKPILIKYND